MERAQCETKDVKKNKKIMEPDKEPVKRNIQKLSKRKKKSNTGKSEKVSLETSWKVYILEIP